MQQQEKVNDNVTINKIATNELRGALKMQNINKYEIGTRIRGLREQAGETQTDLANLLEVKRQIVSYFENGTRTPNIEQLVIMANHYNTTTDYLLGVSEVKTTDKDIQFICDYTGLSEKAIDVLHFYKDYEMIYHTINLLLESEMGSVLEELGYIALDMPEDVLKEKCKENNIDFKELEDIIETKSYECLQVVSAIEQYLNLKKPKADKILSISQSGNIISLSETNSEYSKHLKIDDLFTIKTVNQSEIVEKVVLDNMIEALKNLKKESANNVNNPKT